MAARSTLTLPTKAQVFTLADYDRLWRCQMAVSMLAAITNDVAHGARHQPRQRSRRGRVRAR